jgi:hypothetical protein
MKGRGTLKTICLRNYELTNFNNSPYYYDFFVVIFVRNLTDRKIIRFVRNGLRHVILNAIFLS